MPTKTERILSYLPGTFRALPRPTALYSVADAFGTELLQAENTLVSVMRSHWVDSADQGDEVIDDLAAIAALYGLAPRDDEDVEDFRAHLKRYVKTFLEGTPTVQGILRLTAESLNLLIADSYDQMDTWWNRPDDALTSVEARGDDAVSLLFAPTRRSARGSAARAAQISGSVSLSAPVDLRSASTLLLKIDAAAPVTLNLASLVTNLATATLADIVKAINGQFAPQVVASSDAGQRLVISSPTMGPSSKLAVQDAAGDAALPLLGLAPRTYVGTSAVSAQVTGIADLSAGVDLSGRRYLRLMIDGSRLAEIDCAGPTPASTKLNEIVSAINGALSSPVASQDGKFLTLTSPTNGYSSIIQFSTPAAQDATQTLFGPVNGIYTGRSAQPATVKGTQDLSHGIDLSGGSNIELSLDGGAHIAVNCAGANLASTALDEIVSAINTAAAQPVATHNGQFVALTSGTQGPSSAIRFFSPAVGDATTAIFGLLPRESSGQAASAARITGIDIAGPLDLRAQHLLQIAVDGTSAVTVDFWNNLPNRASASLSDVAASINSAIGSPVATQDGQHLALASTTVGAASSVAVVPINSMTSRRFVTRAFVLNEASQLALGVFKQQAFGNAATPARLEGTAEMARGVDLRSDPFLQLSIDGGSSQLIDCSAGVPRPRLALPEEIVAAINRGIDPTGHMQVASTDGHFLFFTSPTSGASSSVVLQPVLASDASARLGMKPGTVFGRDATGVTFVSTIDLSGGLDLSTASRIKVGIDAAAPVEIDCSGADATHTHLNEIVTRINSALGASIAIPQGKFIALSSPTRGVNSKIVFLPPSTGDATLAILGIGPRAYKGEDAAAPQLIGVADISGGLDLRNAKSLSVSVDGLAPQVVDCSASTADASSAKLPEIVAAINAALKKSVASSDGRHLILTGPTAGASSKLALNIVTSAGAFQRLLGNATQTAQGSDATPAKITGTADLLPGVNLDERRVLRLSIDGAEPLDIDISGAQPDKTFLQEIVGKINAVVPGVASANDDDHLILTSPTTGGSSSLEVLPIRVLEVVEYPPAPALQNLTLKPGDHFSLHNGGADARLKFEITAAQGVAGAEVVNRSTGMRVRVLDAVSAGEALKVFKDEISGIRAEIVGVDGTVSPISGDRILVGPLGSQAWVPFNGLWKLRGGSPDSWASLQLNNPYAPNITVLRARHRGPGGDQISAAVTAAIVPPLLAVVADGSLATLVGRLRYRAGAYTLVDGSNSVLASVRIGTGATPGPFVDLIVAAEGALFPGEAGPPILIANSIAPLFDVTLCGTADDGSPITENYLAVNIGGGLGPRSLVQQVLSLPSLLVVAEGIDKGAVLKLPRGRSEWSYLASLGSRLDEANFDDVDCIGPTCSRFAGGICLEPGVFDVSRFSNMPPEQEGAVFDGTVSGPPAQLTIEWTNYEPGSFAVNLPADLPESFGAHFGQARFGQPGDAPEIFKGIVTEPATDPDYILNRINGQSNLVNATTATNVPLGWVPMQIPFHHPYARPLTGGTDTDKAAMYLAEKGVPGFVVLTARDAGKWGNSIEVTVRKASPGRFDLSIGYEAARFENARQVVFAGKILAPGEDPLPALTAEVLTPRPVGVLQGKAAGVLAAVTRDRTE